MQPREASQSKTLDPRYLHSLMHCQEFELPPLPSIRPGISISIFSSLNKSRTMPSLSGFAIGRTNGGTHRFRRRACAVETKRLVGKHPGDTGEPGEVKGSRRRYFADFTIYYDLLRVSKFAGFGRAAPRDATASPGSVINCRASHRPWS